MLKKWFFFVFLLLLFPLLAACSYDLEELGQRALQSQAPWKYSEFIARDSASGNLEVTVLDVGQGDSIFILLPNDETMLIDAGESQSGQEVIDWLNEKSVDTINYLIATHPHADHIGGMPAVIRAFDIKNIYMPEVSHTTKTFENLLDAIEEEGLEIQIANAGKPIFSFGDLNAEFLAPNRDSYQDLNNYSAVLRLSYGERDFLFMGDAERQSETEILDMGYDASADVLKVGHHGSDTSSSADFLEAVHPHFAVISSGAGNSYGHPHPSTLEEFQRIGAQVLRTDERGHITFTSDGENLEYHDDGGARDESNH